VGSNSDAGARVLLLVPTTSYRADDFLEAAGRLDVALTVATEQPSTLTRHRPDALLPLDFGSPESAVRQVREWCREYPVHAVVGVDDGTVLAAAALAEALGLPGNSPAAVAAARDKHAMRQALAEAGMRSPWFRLFTVADEPRAAADEVPYPAVLKPLVLSASRGVIRADGPEEFAAAFERLRTILSEPDVVALGEASERVLVESFIPGFEVALEGLLTGGELRVLCILDKPDPLDGPFFEETLFVTPSRLPPEVQQAIGEEVARACAVLGLREGPVHAELRVSDNDPRTPEHPSTRPPVWANTRTPEHLKTRAPEMTILEVNPRSIGGRCSRALRFGTGMSLEELILRHALRLEIPSLERERRAAGVMMLPIPRRGILEEVRGQDEALATPGLEELILTAHAGQELVPLPEGAPYLGFLFARGETPQEVEHALREAHRRLEIRLASGGCGSSKLE
jgi:biotin carboxylase